MFVLDTNVLVYAADRGSPQHAACHRLVRESRDRVSAWYLTWGICYEFLRVVTHPRVFRRPWTAGEAWSFIDAVLGRRPPWGSWCRESGTATWSRRCSGSSRISPAT
ncbi:MAG: hypothetical protein A2X52_15120 [Candidatus Rokubacteria bacterium GWC2_70_16]|nr:MAG: hypothetical protein A2X52_15120 [Candidatus Rokubacteria bacterium GWC2_70_16]OGL21289.1 MAG: hypothetical protein A3K12_10620 [Candidatus Rokubacteria bacterium RIFCSPLOWO2_12_FULL_71_19]